MQMMRIWETRKVVGHMDNMESQQTTMELEKRATSEEAVKPRGRGRPRKCPRRELPETEDTDKINAGEEETMNAASVHNGSDVENSAALVVASEGSASGVGSVAVDAAADADADASSVAAASTAADANASSIADASVAADASVPTDGNDSLPLATGTVKPRRRPRKGIPRRSPMY